MSEYVARERLCFWYVATQVGTQLFILLKETVKETISYESHGYQTYSPVNYNDT
jgi:hypothetical protein